MRKSQISGELGFTMPMSAASCLDRLATAVHDLGHADAVARARTARAVGGVRLVRVPDRRVLHVHVARFHLEVGRLDRADLHAVQHVGRLRELHEPVVVAHAAAAPALVEVARERRAADVHPDRHAVGPAHGERALRVATAQPEARGRLRHLLHHEAAVPVDALAVDLLPRVDEQGARRVVLHVGADLLEDAHRLLVDQLFLLGRQDLQRGVMLEHRLSFLRYAFGCLSTSSMRGLSSASRGSMPRSWISSGLPIHSAISRAFVSRSASGCWRTNRMRVMLPK